MSAQEFGEWAVMFRAEQLHPAADRLRHAQALSAVVNGPLQRKDKKLFTPADLLPADPWQRTSQATAKASATDVAQQVGRINALLKGNRK